MYSSTIVEYEDNKSQKLTQSETEDGKNSILDQPPKENIPAEQPLIWRNIIGIPALHVIAIYLFVTRYNEAKFWTWIFGTFLLNHKISSLIKLHLSSKSSFIAQSALELINKYISQFFVKSEINFFERF